jgi:hypothetical protein
LLHTALDAPQMPAQQRQGHVARYRLTCRQQFGQQIGQQ